MLSIIFFLFIIHICVLSYCIIIYIWVYLFLHQKKHKKTTKTLYNCYQLSTRPKVLAGNLPRRGLGRGHVVYSRTCRRNGHVPYRRDTSRWASTRKHRHVQRTSRQRPKVSVFGTLSVHLTAHVQILNLRLPDRTTVEGRQSQAVTNCCRSRLCQTPQIGGSMAVASRLAYMTVHCDHWRAKTSHGRSTRINQWNQCLKF